MQSLRTADSISSEYSVVPCYGLHCHRDKSTKTDPPPPPRDGNVPDAVAVRRLRTLQRQNAENLKQIFPEKEYRSLSPNFHIHVSVRELYIPTMGVPVD
jgi:hypothetical protein